jgi:hypothetical protein
LANVGGGAPVNLVSLGIMPSVLLNLIFDLAGAALILHVVLSTALRALLGRKTQLAHQLFTSRIAILAFLDARYFLPWRAAPAQMKNQGFPVRLLFSLSRIAGMAFPLLMLAFLAGAFYVGARDA